MRPARVAASSSSARRGHQEMPQSLLPHRPAGVNTNPVESLRFSQRVAAANAAGLQRMIGPFARLYATFSPAQKRSAKTSGGAAVCRASLSNTARASPTRYPIRRGLR